MCHGMTRSATVSGQGRGFPQRRSGSLPAEPGKRTSESNVLAGKKIEDMGREVKAIFEGIMGLSQEEKSC